MVEYYFGLEVESNGESVHVLSIITVLRNISNPFIYISLVIFSFIFSLHMVLSIYASRNVDMSTYSMLRSFDMVIAHIIGKTIYFVA